MKSKKPKSKLIKELDVLFSQFVRLSNSIDGFCSCVTCGRVYEWKKIQAGHFISRQHYSVRWDERNVKPQCYGCNVMQQGRQYEFSKYLGQELSEELYLLSKQTRKFSEIELEEMIEHYKNKIVSFS
jgi:hypothetical protein